MAAVGLSGQLEMSDFAALSLLGDGYAWLVPSFVAGVPGVLIVLIILLQMLGGIIWAPSIRRLRGGPKKGANHAPLGR